MWTCRNVLLVLLSIAWTTAQPSRGQDAPVLVEIDDVSLTVPLPIGFESAPNDSKLWGIGERLTPPNARLRAFFISSDDMRRYSSGGKPTLSTYMVVQTHRGSENQILSSQDFLQVRAFIKLSMQGNYSRAANEAGVSKRYQRKLPSRISDKKKQAETGNTSENPIGPWLVSDNSSFLSFVRINKRSRLESQGAILGDDQRLESVLDVAAGATILAKKGKLIFLYTFAPYQSKNDLDEVVQANLNWAEQTVRANR